MEAVNPALAFLAGLLSILSPCVLPLVPIVVGAAQSRHKLGPAALATGLAVSFLGIGLFVAMIGFAIGLDGALFRTMGAVLLVAFGAALLVPALQERLALAAGPIGDWTQRRFADFSAGGLGSQFVVGSLLGIVWSPCVGPTLGAASVMAAQGRNLPTVAITMILFAIGTSAPLLILGLLSREVLGRWRSRLLLAGKGGKAVLGTILVAGGILILFGIDRTIEAGLLSVSPTWLTEISTRF